MDSPYVIVLAHGAGQPMDAPFMETIVMALSDAGIRVGRFEFPYMARRRATGKKALPDRLPVLSEAWRQAVEGIDCSRLIVGGKSMGGRVASMIADEIGAAGLVCLGYPFHPPGKPEKLRTEHLAGLRTPGLFCQGERDTFGSQDEVAGYELSPSIRLEWLGDGDHGFKPRRKSGRTLEQNLAQATDAISDFIHSLSAS
ncbi:MAG: alpha/beta family hydrolase [Alphaproteobacteria bacterium]